MKNIAAWNKAHIAKLVWSVALKKDVLWVKWIHSKYLKAKNWWDYQAPSECSWYWRKVVYIKEIFKKGMQTHLNEEWKWLEGNNYTIKDGYDWLIGVFAYKAWTKVVWARTITPRLLLGCSCFKDYHSQAEWPDS